MKTPKLIAATFVLSCLGASLASAGGVCDNSYVIYAQFSDVEPVEGQDPAASYARTYSTQGKWTITEIDKEGWPNKTLWKPGWGDKTIVLEPGSKNCPTIPFNFVLDLKHAKYKSNGDDVSGGPKNAQIEAFYEQNSPVIENNAEDRPHLTVTIVGNQPQGILTVRDPRRKDDADTIKVFTEVPPANP